MTRSHLTSSRSSVTRRGLLGGAGAAGATGVVAAATLGGAVPAFAGTGTTTADETEFRPRAVSTPQRPNVLVVLVDDVGWGDVGCNGGIEADTPHLDALARSGLRFTDGYAASPVCSPTRIALYTGRHPGRLEGGLPEPITEATPTNGIPPEHPTLASLLKGRGYETAMYGKWHCGFLPWFGPLKSGWDHFEGAMGGSVDYFSKIDATAEIDWFRGEERTPDDTYFTELVTDRAVDFISGRRTRPWLLNVNYNAAHWPWEGPDDHDVSAELTARVRAGETGEAGALAHLDGGSRATFRAMMTALDDGVGRLVRALDDSGQRRNTVVLFVGDNGGERWSYTWPLVGAKNDTREGGVRVPTILSWPGVLPPSTVSHAPVITQDWTATFLELAGARPDPSYPLDGVSLAGHLVRGEPAPEHDLFWRMEGNHALRRGTWKYYWSETSPTGGEPFPWLFDLATDEREFCNLAARNPAKLQELRAAWEAIDATLLPYPGA